MARTAKLSRVVRPVIERMECRRLLAGLTLDTSFGGGDGIATTGFGTSGDSAQAMAVLNGGKILLAGAAGTGPLADWAIARFNADGSLDTTFGGGDGKVTTDIAGSRDTVVSIAVLGSGKFLVAGTSGDGASSDVALARYNADGTLDNTFGGDGKVTTDLADGADRAVDLAILSDGRILLAGTAARNETTDLALVRYNADGTIDKSFGSGAGKVFTGFSDDTDGPFNDEALSLAVLPDGRLRLAATTYERLVVVGYQSDGATDTFFGSEGTFTVSDYQEISRADMVVDPDGDLLLAANLYNAHTLLARISADGSFDGDYYVYDIFYELAANAIALRPDGGLVAAGSQYDDFAVAQFADESFLEASVISNLGGYEQAHAVALLADGRVLAAGETSGDFALVRYAPATLPGSDGDDQIDEAKTIGTASSSSGSITTPTDVDLYKFETDQPLRITFDLDRTAGSSLDSYLRLFDSSGYEIAYSDDDPAPGESAQTTESYLSYWLSYPDTYYVGISGSGNTSYDVVYGGEDGKGSTGGYVLRLAKVPAPADGNDQISEATSIAIGASRAADVGHDLDVDMFKFTAKAGQGVGIDIDLPAGSALIPRLRVFDSTGTEMASDTWSSAPGEIVGGEAYLQMSFDVAGTYYIGVGSDENYNYDPISGVDSSPGTMGKFILVLSNIPVPKDTNDQMSEAASISIGATTAGMITPPTDVNLYKFHADAGRELRFDIDLPSGSYLEPYLRLFGSDGLEMAANSGSAAPGETGSSGGAYFSAYFETAGDYYVGVSGAGNSAYDPSTGNGDEVASEGKYQLLISVAPSDTDDQIQEAKLLTVGATKTGTISTGTDVDMYAVTVKAGQQIDFDIDRATGSALDSFLRLMNGAGDIFVASDNDPAPGESASSESYIRYTFSEAGTYYLGVSGYSNEYYSPLTGAGDTQGSTGGYKITLVNVPVPPPDPDDQIAEAKGLTAFVSKSGNLADGNDVDMFKFTLAAGSSAAISFTTGFDGIGRIFNSAGEEVAYTDIYYDSTLSLDAGSGGTFYVGISGYANYYYNPITGGGDYDGYYSGDYGITLRTPPADGNDQIAEALLIKVGGSTSGSVGFVTDVDMYKFNATADQQLIIRQSTSNGTILQIFDSDGTRLGDPATALAFTAPAKGTYYVAVSADGNSNYDAVTGTGDDLWSGTGSFVLSIAPSPADANDQISEAKGLKVGDAINGSIADNLDVDMFVLTATANQEFNLFARGAQAVTLLRVFDASGKQLARREESLRFVAPSAGKFYVGVSSGANAGYNATKGNGDAFGSTTPYALTVFGADSDDAIPEAKAISIGSTRTDSLSTIIDVDMLKFTAQKGQRLGIDVDRSAGTLIDTYLRLFDASGAEIGTNDNAAAPGEARGRDSYLELLFSESGTYYVSVGSYPNTSFDPATGGLDVLGTASGGYSIRIATA